MSETIERKRIEDYLADLNRRIGRLETGGKPFVGQSDQIVTQLTLSSLALGYFNVLLEWVDPNITVSPNAIPYLTIYVDNDNNPNYRYPSGSSLTYSQANFQLTWYLDQTLLLSNPNKTQCRFSIINHDTNQHTYYMKISFMYMTGTSGGS